MADSEFGREPDDQEWRHELQDLLEERIDGRLRTFVQRSLIGAAMTPLVLPSPPSPTTCSWSEPWLSVTPVESTEGRGAIAWRDLDGLLQEHDYEEHDYEEQHYDDEDGWSSGMENPCTWVHGGLAVELITTTGEVLDQTGALLGRLSDDEVADVMWDMSCGSNRLPEEILLLLQKKDCLNTLLYINDV